MKLHRLIALGALAPVGLALSLQILVEPDQNNVTAGRLAGTWEADPIVSQRLGGAASDRTLEFKKDSTFLGSIPATLAEELRGGPIFESGLVKISEEGQALFNGPYLLTVQSGNPRLLLLHEQDGQPLAGYEAANVFVAPGEQRHNDLLLFGETGSQGGFRSFRRVSEDGTH